ncbi:MAG: hypothetical protein H0U03_10935 [Actinobacteria bacterium]|nr:hypothetical protein [Actinomycetota bacterium]
MTTDTAFARLVSLACHDLRTPLATVHGWARTLPRLTDLDERAARYVDMIATASSDMADLLDLLALAARIEAGRYEPALRDVGTLELADLTAERLGVERVHLEGGGGSVSVDPKAAQQALTGLVACALHQGRLQEVGITADSSGFVIGPVEAGTASTCLGDDLRDFGAAAAVRVVDALGGTVEAVGETLVVRLRAATSAGETGAGP